MRFCPSEPSIWFFLQIVQCSVWDKSLFQFILVTAPKIKIEALQMFTKHKENKLPNGSLSSMSFVGTRVLPVQEWETTRLQKNWFYPCCLPSIDLMNVSPPLRSPKPPKTSETLSSSYWSLQKSALYSFNLPLGHPCQRLLAVSRVSWIFWMVSGTLVRSCERHAGTSDAAVGSILLWPILQRCLHR